MEKRHKVSPFFMLQEDERRPSIAAGVCVAVPVGYL